MAQFVSAPLRPQTPLTFGDYTYYTPEIDPLNQEPTPQEYLPDSLAYFHLDHLGTPIEMTDRTGKTVWEATYQAWGEVETVSGSLKQPFRFQGQYFDEESGLHYNRFRYYDPSSGRFVSQDPIGLEGGINLYEYVPNPVGWIDPFGLSSWLDKAISYGHSIPIGMKNAHGHHIVFKGSYLSNRTDHIAIRAQLQRSKAILQKYNIDVLNSRANLMIAPNTSEVHSPENAKKVAEQLTLADKRISAKLCAGKITRQQAQLEMENALQQIGKRVFGHYR